MSEQVQPKKRVTRSRRHPRETLEGLVNRLDTTLAEVLKLFEDGAGAKISKAERIASFQHVAGSLETVRVRSERAHETAVLSAGSFSLKDAASQIAQRVYTPSLALTAQPGVPSAPAARPEGFIPVEQRKPHLVYDEVSGRAVGRKPAGVVGALAKDPDGMSFLSIADDKTIGE